MDLKESFENAVAKSRTLAKRPSNETLLKMYGLYKQGTEGDVTGDRPGGFDFKAIAKYDAWASLAGMKQEEAMEEYVQLINRLLNT
jgi:acyl-CoA-binding protein